MSKKARVVAIDGPSGSGKSTIAKIISEKCNLTYLDTGAMFRAIGLVLDQKNIQASESSKIKSFLEKMNFEYAKSNNELVVIDGVDLTETIRNHEVSALASKYSQVSEVRSFLKDFQRGIAVERPSVLEGRDIGTVIFPNAVLKFYLRADADIRAKRRLEQLKESDSSVEYDYEKILQDIKSRDDQDQNRKIAPLKKANDAIEIDSTSLSIPQVVEAIVDKIKQVSELKA